MIIIHRVIDGFARTLKKTFTRICINNNHSNRTKHLDKVIDNFEKLIIGVNPQL